MRVIVLKGIDMMGYIINSINLLYHFINNIILSSCSLIKYSIIQSYSFAKSLAQRSIFFTRFKVNKSYFSFNNWSVTVKEATFIKTVNSHYFARLLRQGKTYLEMNGYTESAAEEVVVFFAPLLVIDGGLSLIESAYSYANTSVEDYFNLEALDFGTPNLAFSMNNQLQGKSEVAAFVYHIEKLQRDGAVIQRDDFFREFNTYKKEKAKLEILSVFLNGCISCLDKYVSVVFDNFLKGKLTTEVRESAGFLVRFCENIVPPLLLGITLLVTVTVYVLVRVKQISRDLVPFDLSGVNDYSSCDNILQAQHDRLLLLKSKIILSQDVIAELEQDILRLRQMHTLVDYAKAKNKVAFLNNIRDNYAEHMVMPIVYLKAIDSEIDIDLDQIDLVNYVKGNIKRLEDKYSIKNMIYIQLSGTVKALYKAILDQIPSISELVVFTILYNAFVFVSMPQMTIALFVSLVLLKPVIKHGDSLVNHIISMVALSNILWFFRAQKFSAYFGFNTVDTVKVYNQDRAVLTPNEKKVFRAKLDAVRQSRKQGVGAIIGNSYLFEHSHVLNALLNTPI